jgi:hypothetical protein
MSTPCGWRVLLVVLLWATTPVVAGQLVDWSFANFSSAGVISNLVLLGDAAVENATGPSRLVLNGEGAAAGVASTGRAVYSSQLDALASFTTNFTFAITDLGAGSPRAGCGGFTFNVRGDKSSLEDIATYNLCPSAADCTTLVNSGVFFTRIRYNASLDSLQVELRLQNATTQIASWTVTNASLQSVVKEFMYVGFSGSNGVGCNQSHEIFSWSFSTDRSLGPGPAPHVSYTCYRALVIGIAAAVGCSAVVILVLWLCWKKQSEEYATGQDEGSKPPPASETGAVAQAVEPKAVAPVVEPVNRNARGKVVVMCCVQTRPKRDCGEPVEFSLKELAQATKGFSEVIGGSRVVYRGVLRDNGAVVAVKEIALDSTGFEFVDKAVALGRMIRHPNLVQLLGWCQAPERGKLYLVHDYMPRGSLDKLLLLRRDQDGFLTLDARYRVLVGVAAALAYLHENWDQCVLVKPSNILLDATFTAHLGTFHELRKPTVKSEVFSFGVLALAVACGCLDEDRVLVDSVWRARSNNDLLSVLDRNLDTYSEQQVTSLVDVALWCAHPDPSLRPSMASAWQTLVGKAQAPDLPATKPVVENYAALSTDGPDLLITLPGSPT